MKTKQETCGTCGGSGLERELVYADIGCGVRMKSERIMGKCKACGGKGYVEYATFTVEEAKAILKHCGLSTES